jgi:hypothetical protein
LIDEAGPQRDPPNDWRDPDSQNERRCEDKNYC